MMGSQSLAGPRGCSQDACALSSVRVQVVKVSVCRPRRRRICCSVCFVSVQVHVLVHVINGVLDELEVYREDSDVVVVAPSDTSLLEVESWVD